MIQPIQLDPYVIIVQARMGSKRLPGKMLRTLQGSPLLDHVLNRLLAYKKEEKACLGIVLATSNIPENEPLSRHVKVHFPAVDLIEGPEEDVLERFLMALRQFPEAKNVVRVTGDCPFLNMEALDGMLRSHQTKNASITNYEPGHEYVDKGIEVASRDALERIASNPRVTPSDREHVTSFLYHNAGDFRVNYIQSNPVLRRADIHIAVDTEKDLFFLEALTKEIGKPVREISVYDLITHLDGHPQLLNINLGSAGKSSRHEPIQIVFRCDGGLDLGMGHIHGSLRLAKLLSRELAAGIEFVVKDNPAVISLLSKNGFSVEVLPPDISPEEDIAHLMRKRERSEWAALVINFSREQLIAYDKCFDQLMERSGRLIFQDNPLPSSKSADLVINALPYPGSQISYDPPSIILDGLAYFLVSEDLYEKRRVFREEKRKGSAERILVSLGGSDALNITQRVLEALAHMQYGGFVDIVLGHANESKESIEAWWQDSGLNGSVNCGVDDMPERMLEAGLGISGVGLTAYEMLYAGLPHVLLSSHELNHAVAQKHAETWEACSYIGRGDRVPLSELTEQIKSTLDAVSLNRSNASSGRINEVGSRCPEIIEWFKMNCTRSE